MGYVLFRLLAVAWAALIFFLSSQPGAFVDSTFPGQDKVGHILLYGILGCLVALGLHRDRIMISWKDIATVTLIVTVYGMTDEWHQSLVPTRVASIGDLFADSVGGFVAVCMVKSYQRFFAVALSRE